MIIGLRCFMACGPGGISGDHPQRQRRAGRDERVSGAAFFHDYVHARSPEDTFDIDFPPFHSARLVIEERGESFAYFVEFMDGRGEVCTRFARQMSPTWSKCSSGRNFTRGFPACGGAHGCARASLAAGAAASLVWDRRGGRGAGKFSLPAPAGGPQEAVPIRLMTGNQESCRQRS